MVIPNDQEFSNFSEMKKLEWYKNRILWRARKNRLDSCLWNSFLISNEAAARKVLDATEGYEHPLLIFWLNDDVWTVLTAKFLLGKIDGVFASVELDNLGEVSTANDDNLYPQELKKRAEYIEVGLTKTRFWTDPGINHFSLRNILGMFPIRTP